MNEPTCEVCGKLIYHNQKYDWAYWRKKRYVHVKCREFAKPLEKVLVGSKSTISAAAIAALFSQE